MKNILRGELNKTFVENWRKGRAKLTCKIESDIIIERKNCKIWPLHALRRMNICTSFNLVFKIYEAHLRWNFKIAISAKYEAWDFF